MAINLQKGQKVNLRKEDGATLRRVMIGLGWDEVEKKKGLFAFRPQDIDCDATVFLCKDGRFHEMADAVCYFNLYHYSGAVQHMGDNLTGAGEGDCEQIFVDMSKLPKQYTKLVFVVNIYRARQRQQHFGMVKNAFIRICDDDTHRELCRYNLSENYDNMTAMVFGEIYNKNGEWKFNAIGQGTTDNSIEELAKRFS